MAARDSHNDEPKPGKARSAWNAWLRSADPLTPLLDSDERVIWRARGSGFDHRPYIAAIYGALAVMAIVWAWPKMPAEQIRLPELQPMAGALIFVFMLVSLYHGGGRTERRGQLYTLTDRRLFVQAGAHAQPVPLTRAQGKLGLRIAAIAVETEILPGDITLFVEGSAAPYILRGIKNPLEIASLIKSTLGLDIEIQPPAS